MTQGTGVKRSATGGSLKPAIKRRFSVANDTVEVDNFEPKNILITGGAGFIASHVVILLAKKYPNYKIVNLDKMDYCSSLNNLKEVEDLPNYKFVKGNILSADLIEFVLETEKIDTICHFAAQTHVGESLSQLLASALVLPLCHPLTTLLPLPSDNSFGNSFTFTENNVMGTHTLLECAKNHNITRFVHVSTDEVYGSSYEHENSKVEGDALEPTNPYAATKAAAENMVKSYWHSFDLPVIITRGNNVYGPHQYPEKVIPKFIRRLHKGMPCCMHGDGSSSRHFLFVTDVARAFDTIIHKGVPGNVYNIGAHREVTNLELAETLIKRMYPKDDVKKHLEFVADRPFNDVRYYLNFDKLMELGWKPEVELEEGLSKTIDWYKTVSTDWWDVGTDSSLAAHPKPKQ